MHRLAPLIVATVVLAGCGGGGKPPVDPATGTRLARQADAVAARAAAGDPCGASARAQALQRAAITAINGHRIPPRYQEALLGRANELVAELGPRCLPTPPPAPAPAPAPTAVSGGDNGFHGHDHGHGHGRHGGKDG